MFIYVWYTCSCTFCIKTKEKNMKKKRVGDEYLFYVNLWMLHFMNVLCECGVFEPAFASCVVGSCYMHYFLSVYPLITWPKFRVALWWKAIYKDIFILLSLPKSGLSFNIKLYISYESQIIYERLCVIYAKCLLFNGRELTNMNINFIQTCWSLRGRMARAEWE